MAPAGLDGTADEVVVVVVVAACLAKPSFSRIVPKMLIGNPFS
jgi:hypothetical protein